MALVTQNRFIGALSFLFPNQVQNDIYLDNHWTTVGVVRRIAFATARWGVCVAVIQLAVALVVGQPGPFQYDPASHNLINMNNHGMVPPPPLGLPHVHQQLIGQFVINGNLVQGYAIIWHRKYSITGNPVGRLLHYHEHQEREDHGPEHLDIKPQAEGNHLIGRRLIFGTQVQGFRQLAPN